MKAQEDLGSPDAQDQKKRGLLQKKKKKMDDPPPPHILEQDFCYATELAVFLLHSVSM